MGNNVLVPDDSGAAAISLVGGKIKLRLLPHCFGDVKDNCVGQLELVDGIDLERNITSGSCYDVHTIITQTSVKSQ